jgi:hypothetical protein
MSIPTSISSSMINTCNPFAMARFRFWPCFPSLGFETPRMAQGSLFLCRNDGLALRNRGNLRPFKLSRQLGGLENVLAA